MNTFDTAFESIKEQLAIRRALQDKEWGGPVHDDEHELGDWLSFIAKQLLRALTDSPENEEWPPYEVRVVDRIQNIGALCIACLESVERKNA